MNNIILFVARLLLAHMFFLSGIQKIVAYSATVGYMANYGVPALLLPPVIALEIIAPICLVVGFLSRFAAYLLALFCILAAVIFHTDFSQLPELISFMKNLTIAGGLLVLGVYGPGTWALGTKRAERLFS